MDEMSQRKWCQQKTAHSLKELWGYLMTLEVQKMNCWKLIQPLEFIIHEGIEKIFILLRSWIIASHLSEFFIQGKNFKHYPNKFSSGCFYNINTPVLKCRFCYCSGRMRPTDQQMSLKS